MAKVSFYLTNPKAKGTTPLFCFINYGLYTLVEGKKKYLPLKYYTSIEMIPDLWNKDTNRAKESIKWATPESYSISRAAVDQSAKKKYGEINRDIESFERNVKDILFTLCADGNIPSHQKLRSEIDKIYRPGKFMFETEVPKELFKFVDYLISTSTNKESTVKSYKVVRKNLIDFQEKKKIALTFQNIDIDFYNAFIDFLTKQNLAKNTIGTRIKIIKTFLSEANERGLKVSDDYKKRSFAKPKEETHSIYLSEPELQKILNIENSGESRKIMYEKYNLDKLPAYLDRVRDLFLVGCYTGLRFSDLTKISVENITSDNDISIKTQKTGQNVVVPIHPITLQILNKYNYQLPSEISNQKFNEYLKVIAEIAGVDEPVTKEITKGKFIVAETEPKYNFVTSHTARRSFATNAFLMDMPTISIMKITGHKTESAFMKYIKMSAKDNAAKMKSHKFFNPLLIAK